jgi:ABC-2 type transport system permease protein
MQMEDHKMNELADMIWVEQRKAIRSRMPIWTALGGLVMPLGIAFLIFVSKNPEISQKLGLISAKANLLAYSATDWAAYMVLFGQMAAIGGFMLCLLITSWIFGREFTDGTVKDMLAVPVQRGNILLAKYIVVGIWSAALVLVMLIAGLTTGVLIKLPGGAIGDILRDSMRVAATGGMTIVVVTPFALFASMGRGYLLPIGLAILTLTNIVALIGWGEYFPWAVPGLYAQGKTALPAVSYWIVVITGLVGILLTYVWWKYADQNR